ncbi:hypothetical protein PG987_015429 [Apiospora arundinis]
MRVSIIIPIISGLLTLPLASPITNAALGDGLVARSSNVFKYCTNPSLEGNCNVDDHDSLTHCETTSFKTVESLKVYRGYKCTIYMASGCTGDSRAYTAGEVPNIPAMYQNFPSYKCVRDD